MGILRVLSYVFAGTSVACLLVSAALFWPVLQLDQGGQTVTAIVDQTDEVTRQMSGLRRGSQQQTEYKLTFTFVTEQGPVTDTATVWLQTFQAAARSGEVQVTYLPSDPRVNMAERGFRMMFVYILAGAAVFFGVMVFVARAVRRDKGYAADDA